MATTQRALLRCDWRKNIVLALTQLYNVRATLKSGAALSEEEEERIKRDGLVLVLAELHDDLDAAVADAYGWPADLAEAELLSRLVALNKERAREEADGRVRWLRPDYQIPRFGSESEKAKQFEADLGAPVVTLPKGGRVAFPKGDLEQTVAVLAALARADTPLDAASLAAGFTGRGVAPAIAKILTALHRMGQTATSDGGRSFSLRRVA